MGHLVCCGWPAPNLYYKVISVRLDQQSQQKLGGLEGATENLKSLEREEKTDSVTTAVILILCVWC